MDYFIKLSAFIFTFLIVAIASERISARFQRLGVPLISGFLLVGILCGPHALNLIDHTTAKGLFFINDIALSFIAFAASSELYLKELRSRIKSIQWLTLGQLIITFLLITIAIVAIAELIPFLSERTLAAKISIALLCAAVLCARSPASVIAVINEMRAKGSFSSTVLGATVLIDFLIIIVFAICFSTATTLLSSQGFNIMSIVYLIGQIVASVSIGILYGFLLRTLLKGNIHKIVKAIFIVLIGFSSYGLYYLVSYLSFYFWQVELHLEPLLICLIGSFYVVNYTNQRQEFLRIIHDLSPYIYTVFFTYAGALLAINVLADVWQITLVICGINALALYIGTYTGARIGGEDRRYSRKYWTSFLTQAGVGLGLATIVSSEFEEWGDQFSAIIISVIVINQLIGPVLFKRSIINLGESRLRATTPDFDGIRDALIIGFETQSVALARQLQEHGWKAKIATRKVIEPDKFPDVELVQIDGLTLEALESLDAHLSEAIVLMLTDEENLAICELIYENIGTKEIVVRLNNQVHSKVFHKMGALIVDTGTAIVSLLDHFVRSPQATSLLLGMKEGQDTIDLEVLNPDLFGIYLRDLRFPSDVIVLSVQRKGQMIISHGYTRLRKGDIVTIVGSEESLIQMTDLFDG
ncbi:potassium transporter TrkA [Fulvivirga sp. RKSG066]|uniref:cation:proton antiporter domain-containing protein n=1 Tax=Fulvivirga aurantia TaxID=2529383 RepID=UPI0012BBBF6B|nr:cation:proton antiporter [Fulvivirga aurantia]MTI21717.1 potassium transporter TrkA [Fulvivirga aurantia]